MSDATQETIPPYERLKALVDPDAYKPGFLRRAMNTSAAVKTVSDAFPIVALGYDLIAGDATGLAFMLGLVVTPACSTTLGIASLSACAGRISTDGAIQNAESGTLKSCRSEFLKVAKNYLKTQTASTLLMATFGMAFMGAVAESIGGADTLSPPSSRFAPEFYTFIACLSYAVGNYLGWKANKYAEKLNVYEAAIKTVERKQKNQPPSATVSPVQPT